MNDPQSKQAMLRIAADCEHLAEADRARPEKAISRRPARGLRVNLSGVASSNRNNPPETTMKRIAILAAFALAIGIGGAQRVVACEDGSYAMDEPAVTALQVASCQTNNCATVEPVVTVPQAGECNGYGCARPETTPEVAGCAYPTCVTEEPPVTASPQAAADCPTAGCARPEPKLETVLKELGNATVRAVKNADDPMKAFACSTSPSCASRR
jgi:hypothetical protein